MSFSNLTKNPLCDSNTKPWPLKSANVYLFRGLRLYVRAICESFGSRSSISISPVDHVVFNVSWYSGKLPFRYKIDTTTRIRYTHYDNFLLTAIGLLPPLLTLFVEQLICVLEVHRTLYIEAHKNWALLTTTTFNWFQLDRWKSLKVTESENILNRIETCVVCFGIWKSEQLIRTRLSWRTISERVLPMSYAVLYYVKNISDIILYYQIYILNIQ